MLRQDPKDPTRRLKYKRKKIPEELLKGDIYQYYNIETKKHLRITKPEMAELGINLPMECSTFLLDAKKTHRVLNNEENSKLLKLCSLSLSVWNGNPKGKLPYVSMEEFRNEFYIQMIKFLTCDGKSRFDPSRAKWPAFVKWIRLSSMNTIMQSYTTQKTMIDAAVLELQDLEHDGRTMEEVWMEIMSYAPKNQKKKEEETEDV